MNSGFSSKGGHKEEHEILVLDVTSHTGRGYGEFSSSNYLNCDAKDGPRSGTSPRQQSIVAKYVIIYALNYRSIVVRSSSPRFVIPIRMSAYRIPVRLHIHQKEVKGQLAYRTVLQSVQSVHGKVAHPEERMRASTLQGHVVVENSCVYHVTSEGPAIVKSRAQFKSTIVEWKRLEVEEVGSGRHLGSRKERMKEKDRFLPPVQCRAPTPKGARWMS